MSSPRSLDQRLRDHVDRHVLELTTMLPDPPAATPDVDTVLVKMRVLGALGHLAPIQDVVRMLYYLTGQATERSAVLAYNLLHERPLRRHVSGVTLRRRAPAPRSRPGRPRSPRDCQSAA